MLWDTLGYVSGSSCPPANLHLTQLIGKRLSTQALGLARSGSQSYLISYLTFINCCSSLASVSSPGKMRKNVPSPCEQMR